MTFPSHVKQEPPSKRQKVGDAEEDLPDGWRKVWCDEHEEWYFWNSLTKESSWLHPQPSKALKGHVKDEKADDEPLPKGWERLWDDERRAFYYWHTATRTSSWQRPNASKEHPGKADEIAEIRVTGKIVEWSGISGWIQPDHCKHPLLNKKKERIYVNWRDVHTGVTPEVNMDVEFLVYSDDNGLAATDVIPQGAELSLDSIPSRRRQRRLAAEKAASIEAKQEVSEESDEGPLLPGWEQHWSEEHKCNFYVHVATSLSSWERPSLPRETVKEEKLGEGEFGATPTTPESGKIRPSPSVALLKQEDSTPPAPSKQQANRLGAIPFTGRVQQPYARLQKVA
jgi:hypothetical protein